MVKTMVEASDPFNVAAQNIITHMAADGSPELPYDLVYGFVDAVNSVLHVDPERIVPTARFGDDLDNGGLGADSLDFVEVASKLEEDHEIDIPYEDLENLATVAQVVGYLATMVANKELPQS